jgi:hypothetical protein
MLQIQGPIEAALDILRDALVPFVEQSLATYYVGRDWFNQVNINRQGRRRPINPLTKDAIGRVYWSPDDLMNTMAIGEWAAFQYGFKRRSVRPGPRVEDRVAKGWIEELMEIRRRVAHQEPITPTDVNRFLDTAELLLGAAHSDAAADNLRNTFRSFRGKLSVASIRDVVDWNWDGKVLLDHLIKLDYATITGLTELSEGKSESWAPVFMDHPDTWRLLIDGINHIVGYWHFVTLFDDDYQTAKSGKLHDGQITTDRVRFSELPGIYKLYFVSMSIMPRYRGTVGLKLLVDALFEILATLAEHHVFFSEVCTNAFSPDGIALCRTLGMHYICDHEDNGKLFGIELMPLPNVPILSHYPRLVQMYEKAAMPGNAR